jgi:hypothetical protein
MSLEREHMDHISVFKERTYEKINKVNPCSTYN